MGIDRDDDERVMTFITIGNVIIHREKVTALYWEDHEVILIFDNGERLKFTDEDATFVWREFDGGGWRE